MVIIRFLSSETERKALGYLAGRFSFKSWETGETMVPETALAPLAAAGISFLVQGPANYEQLAATVRDPAAAAV